MYKAKPIFIFDHISDAVFSLRCKLISNPFPFLFIVHLKLIFISTFPFSIFMNSLVLNCFCFLGFLKRQFVGINMFLETQLPSYSPFPTVTPSLKPEIIFFKYSNLTSKFQTEYTRLVCSLSLSVILL